jgi:SynChlorMet cassette radical SAM/SPASM protein ScmE
MSENTMKVMNTPKSLDLEITNRCNLHCSYCSHFTSAGDVNQDLPKEEWLKFFEELNRCAVLEVCLGGGEPFIRKDFKDIVEGIIRNRMRFSIVTNGTLINDEIAVFLASTGRCNSIQISIDGSIPMTHDVFRGNGTFLMATKGIRRLQKYHLPMTVRVTIHRYNVKDLENIAKLLLEEIGLPSFSTNSASYMGLCRKNYEQIALTPAERSLAMETLLHLTRKYNGRISATAGPLAEGKTYLEMEKARRKGRETIAEEGYLSGCKGPMRKMAIRADGVMVPCNQMSHIELGWINKDNLKEVWKNHPELKRLRERSNLSLRDFSFCKGCDYVDYCTGNCPALAYTLYGIENHPSPDACLKRFLETGGRLPEENLYGGQFS